MFNSDKFRQWRPAVLALTAVALLLTFVDLKVFVHSSAMRAVDAADSETAASLDAAARLGALWSFHKKPGLFVKGKPADPTQRFISIHLQHGLNNQRVSFRDALLFARRSKRTLVLPAWVRSRGQFDVDWQNATGTSQWRSVPFSSVFDVHVLTSCAAKFGVRVIAHPLPLPTWLDDAVPGSRHRLSDAVHRSTLRHGYGTPPAPGDATYVPPPDLWLNQMVPPMLVSNWTVGNSTHIRITNQVMLAIYAPEHGVDRALQEEQELLDRCITYAPHIVRTADAIARELEKHYGTKITDMPYVHLRVEDDFTMPFGGMENAKRVVYHAALCMRHVGLPREAHGPNDGRFRFMVACGDPLDSPKLQELHDRYHTENILSKDIVAPAIVARFRREWGEDVLAAVDMILAVASKQFVGVAPSTFSQQIARERLRLGKESWLTVGGGFVRLELEKVCRLFVWDSWPY